MASVVVLFLAIIIAVALVAFLSARRFGVLSLGLAAGSVLAGLWSSWLADWLSSMDWQISWLPVGVLSTIIVLLSPLVILLISGPKYHRQVERIVSALAVGLLTAAFLIQPLGKFMKLDGDALVVYQWLASVWQYVVSVGLVLGVMDLFIMNTKKPAKNDKKH